MGLKATEVHRVGRRVLLSFKDDSGQDVYPSGRYVDCEDTPESGLPCTVLLEPGQPRPLCWDHNPDDVMAEVYEYLGAKSAPVQPTVPAQVKEVVRDDAALAAHIAVRKAEIEQLNVVQEEAAVQPGGGQ